MAHRKVTISDVARDAGVSIATVSRVMQGKQSVSADLASRVQTVALRLGYRPSPMARGLATGETGMVGVLVPELDNPHFHEVIKAIGTGAGQDGYRVLILESEGRSADEPDLAASLYDHADGVFLCSPRMPDERLQHPGRRPPPLPLRQSHPHRDRPPPPGLRFLLPHAGDMRAAGPARA